MNWYLQVLKKYSDFEGRANRSEYWYFNLFNILALLVLAGIASQLRFFWVVYFLYFLGVLAPSLAVTVRRFHDIGKSGYWLFIALIPFVGGLALLYFTVQPSQPKKNDYGAVPK